MIVRHWEKFTFPCHDPPFTVGSLTLRAVSIATRVVADGFFTTITTSAHMAAQSGCSANAECSQCFPYLYNRLKLPFELLAMKMDNICYFISRIQGLQV